MKYKCEAKQFGYSSLQNTIAIINEFEPFYRIEQTHSHYVTRYNTIISWEEKETIEPSNVSHSQIENILYISSWQIKIRTKYFWKIRGTSVYFQLMLLLLYV